LIFFDNLYQTVSNPKDYLKFCYGDWQTAKRTSIKSEYLTSEHIQSLKLHNVLLQRIKISLSNIKKMNLK